MSTEHVQPDELSHVLQKAMAGDHSARQRMALRCHKTLMGIIRADITPAIRDILDAEDVLHEVYMAVIAGFDLFRGDDFEAFRKWAATIARNKLREMHRRYAGTKKRGAEFLQRQFAAPFSQSYQNLSAVLSARITSVPGRAVRVEALESLAAALATLPEHYRMVIELRYLHGLSVDETADKLGKSKGSVLMTTHRAMRQLAETIRQFPLLTRA